jgi:hypothetical protein
MAAIIPLLILASMQRTSLALTPPLSVWASAFAGLWAIIGCLAILDPSLASKISMLKDLKGLLSPNTDRSDSD